MEIMKQTIDFPVTFNKDVIVVGGGCAGVVAALAAARNGAATLLVERAGYLGGMLTGGLVHSLHGYRFHQNYVGKLPMSNWSSELLVKGITLEIYDRILKAKGTINPDRAGDPSVRENVDEEITMLVLEEMMQESGVEVLYNTIAFSALKEKDAVTGIIFANKSGPQIAKAKVVVDATADADIAVSAGCETLLGHPDTNQTHGGALLMEIGGIDAHRYIDYVKNRPSLSEEESAALEKDRAELFRGGSPLPQTALSLTGERGSFTMAGKPQSWEQIEKAYQEGKYLMLPGISAEWTAYVKANPDIPHMINTRVKKSVYPPEPRFSWFGLVRDGKLRYDQCMTGVHELFFDQTNELEISKAIQLMRKIDFVYMHFLKSRVPGFENAYIIKTSPLVGTRESRRIVGEYTLSAEDCVNGRMFDDAVAVCGRACNVHNMDMHAGLWYWLEPKGVYALPYRCLIPKGVENLLVAGRCSSVDFIALGATRSMPTCMSLGEGAGTAAALAAKNGVKLKNLDIKLLQSSLLKQGVLLPEPITAVS